MVERPLLIFPEKVAVSRHSRGSFPPQERKKPSPQQQSERLAPKFKRLEEAFEKRRLALLARPDGIDPESAIVFEVARDIDNFVSAVERIQGLEWLADMAREDLDPETGFSRLGRGKEMATRARLYVVMSDRRGARELVSLFRRFREDPKKPAYKRGLTKWRDLFHHLYDVRFWGPQDRIEETGLREDWEERLHDGEETVRIEVELWYRRDTDKRTAAERRLYEIVEEAGGHVVSQCQIGSIDYHAFLIDLPMALFDAVCKKLDARIVSSEDVMFLRPQGQSMVRPLDDEVVAAPTSAVDDPLPSGAPSVALLDGLPLENHALLQGRIFVDDPDEWAGTYGTEERVHGTAMASLIVHGDLADNPSAMPRPLYVRPLLQPDSQAWERPAPERTPPDRLVVDLVHQAVHRLFERDGSEPPASDRVRVINLSLGDDSRPFFRAMSPWARLLDSLSYRYRVLFVVSAGNYSTIDHAEASTSVVEDLSGSDFESFILNSIYESRHLRRILSPSESINALTIGALHSDSSAVGYLGPYNKEPYLPSSVLPSPNSALGLGFRRSVKPDLVEAGGRRVWRIRPDRLEVVRSPRPPGQLAALPPGPSDTLVSRQGYCAGTSNSAALTTRSAARIIELLDELRTDPSLVPRWGHQGNEKIPEDLTAVLVKALLVHGASWHGLDSMLQERVSSQLSKDDVMRFVGYGRPSIDRVLACTDQRATLIGCGNLRAEEAHRYRLPLPPSLSGRVEKRRLTATLTWLTPINVRDHRYRKASLWFEPHGDRLEVKKLDKQGVERKSQGRPVAEQNTLERLLVRRLEGDNRTVRRGTVQHEVFEGERATAFADGDEVDFQVNCRAEAGKLTESICYAFVVTLEVAEGLGIPLYEEIAERLIVPVAPH